MSLVLIFAGCMRSGIARTRATCLGTPALSDADEPREMFRLHWPGSRLARRPGPAAAHLGNRCFQKSRPVGQAEYQQACLAGIQLTYRAGATNPFTLPGRLLVVLHPSRLLHHLDLVLSTKDSKVKSVARRVWSGRTLLLIFGLGRTKAVRPPYAATPCQVPQSQSWCCRQHSSTHLHMPSSHPFLVHWRILPSSCATVSR